MATRSTRRAVRSARAMDRDALFRARPLRPRRRPAKRLTRESTIMDPVAGVRYELDSSTMIAYESHIPKMPVRSSGSPTPPAPTATTRTLPNGATQTVTLLGTQTVNGVQATGTQITEVIPAGAIGNSQPITNTRITWIATDLHVPVQIKSTDPRIGSTDMELTNISTGEPSATLFSVPSTYTVQNGGRGMGRGPRGPEGGSGHPGGRPGRTRSVRPARRTAAAAVSGHHFNKKGEPLGSPFLLLSRQLISAARPSAGTASEP